MTHYTYHPPLHAWAPKRNQRAERMAALIPREMLRLTKGRVLADVVLRFGVGYHTARDVVRIAFAEGRK